MAGSSQRSRVGPLSQWRATPAAETVEEPVGQVLARQVAARPDRPALYWPEAGGLASMTYAELGEAAHRLGCAMAGRAGPGERVAVWSRVAKYKIPVAWRFVESFPMTASGKVRRFVVRDETNKELR